jgi:hypothetical protein
VDEEEQKRMRETRLGSQPQPLPLEELSGELKLSSREGREGRRVSFESNCLNFTKTVGLYLTLALLCIENIFHLRLNHLSSLPLLLSLPLGLALQANLLNLLQQDPEAPPVPQDAMERLHRLQ